jgi:hypothetical protein
VFGGKSGSAKWRKAAISLWFKHSRLVACIATVTILSVASSALADWWVIRSSDGKCLVVDIEPTGNNKDVTKIGKAAYPSADQAEADAKRLCRDQPANKSRKQN